MLNVPDMPRMYPAHRKFSESFEVPGCDLALRCPGATGWLYLGQHPDDRVADHSYTLPFCPGSFDPVQASS